ncbi:uncharacterized protein LOC107261223 [Ricinus communis]|uniref:uncharacterized protein LOC107261223 n=1 Tax=Ricinus communis TaxID=3988 RepID=UPI0007724858|nr:uncharacterized protein LOC107261223 [Ricinus communis]|eukprot:XP_015574439.1 uncharacterized protein LOC107261223 [Ricinus communis]
MPRGGGKDEVDALTTLQAQITNLTKEIDLKVGQKKENKGKTKVDEATPYINLKDDASISSNQEELINEDKEDATPLPPKIPSFVPPIPYPQSLKRHVDAKQYAKYLEMFKKLQINILFVEALAHMPNYGKFLKKLIYNKNKLEEYDSISVIENCSAIMLNQMPQKLQDSGSFTSLCTIGNVEFKKALLDLGASIHLMPLYVFKKLGLGEM